MIFVTVGTHEQQFDRLIEKVDELVLNGTIEEEVIIQSGFSTYNTKKCITKKLIPYSEMMKNIEKARIIITHGGPATFVIPLQMGKIPIVVPRQKKFNEHVNDHQLEFAKMVSERQGNIIVIEDIKELEQAINKYNDIVEKMPREVASNNEKFNKEFKCIIDNIFYK